MSTVFCPNRNCGKEVSDQFEKCPFCGTPLQKRSVDDVLDDFSEEEKRKKESHKEEVLNHFHLDGDVSDEQFEELDKKYQQSIGKCTPFLLTPNAEPILNKYGTALKIIGIVLMVRDFIIAIVFLFLFAIEENGWCLLGTTAGIIVGILTYFVFIIIKAFIDVFVNISLTLQDINFKTIK